MSEKSKPPKKNHPYYGARYSVAVLGWDNDGNLILNLVCWDYITRGWVCADLRDGPDSRDYELEVSAWMLPPDMPITCRFPSSASKRQTRRRSS